MANRPGKLCTIQKGLAIGSQDSFADTFNWLVACVRNLRAGKGCRVTWPASDTPQIEATDQSAEGSSTIGGFAYNRRLQTISAGVVMFGRRAVRAEGKGSVVSGCWRVKATLGTSPLAEIEAGDGFESPTGTVSYIPLYSISGTVVTDYRFAMTVPCWE